MTTQYQSPISTHNRARWTAFGVGDATACHLATDDLFLDPHDGDTTYMEACYPNSALVDLKLEAPPKGTPTLHTGHQVVISVRRTAASATNPTLGGALYEGNPASGGTFIAGTTWALANSTVGNYVGRQFTLTPTEAGTIGDYSNLYVQLYIVSWSTTADCFRVSSVELRTPIPGGAWLGPFMWNQ